MSWSVQAVGRAAAVAASIEQQFAQSSCSEPEESVRQSARATIAAALAAQSPESVVQVSAQGSQSASYNSATNSYGLPFNNSLEIKVQPLYGFVE